MNIFYAFRGLLFGVVIAASSVSMFGANVDRNFNDLASAIGLLNTTSFPVSVQISFCQWGAGASCLPPYTFDLHSTQFISIPVPTYTDAGSGRTARYIVKNVTATIRPGRFAARNMNHEGKSVTRDMSALNRDSSGVNGIRLIAIIANQNMVIGRVGNADTILVQDFAIKSFRQQKR